MPVILDGNEWPACEAGVWSSNLLAGANIGVWCNGSTAASKSVCQGSNPCTPAKILGGYFACQP